MKSFYNIKQVARYEVKLLFRSWGFRVFAGLGLLLIAVLAVGIGTSVVRKPYFFFALPGSLPLNSIKLFNVFQGIIAAFLATEFFKRDRRHDTNEVVFARSFSNLEYTLGKVLGIVGVFVVLNAAVMAVTFVVHFFFSGSGFVLGPYIFYPLLYSLPTVVFMVGLSVLLVNLIRSQAVVFILVLGYSFFALVFMGAHQFGIWDSYGFYQPLVYSDFTGLVGLGEFLQVRFVYFLLGIAFICLSVLLNRRLRQAAAPNFSAGIVAAVCLLGAAVLGAGYINAKEGDGEYRQALKAKSKNWYSYVSPMVTFYHIDLRQEGEDIFVTAALGLKNDSPEPLSSFVLTLNPGLTVTDVRVNREKPDFKQEEHLLRLTPRAPVAAGGDVQVSVVYSGKIDERYCYLDIPGAQLEDRYRLWVYDIPKRYAIVNSHYLLLTPESGWYPVPGLAPGAAFPQPFKRNFSKFKLTVRVPEGMHAISQGQGVEQTVNGERVVTFEPEKRLPQVSLTMGEYERRQIKVDGVMYSLYTLRGHDYFEPYFKDIKDFGKLIRDLKADYEVMLGLDYPYGQLSLVEVPIQFYSYKRAWTSAPETVQPQVVFLPEMGATCSGADFEFFTRMMRTRFGRRGTPRSPEEMQRALFRRFIRANFLEKREDMSRFFMGDGVSDAIQSNVEARFELFPNMVTYVNHISSEREGAGPMLNVALESFMQAEVFSPRSMFRRFLGGLTEAEETNLLLNGRSLKDLAQSGPGKVSTEIILEALNQKGKHLFAILETKLAEKGVTDFQEKFKAFLTERRFKTITEKEFREFFLGLGDIDLDGILDTWVNGSQLPGFVLENFESYQVLDAEDAGVDGDGQVKTQVKFRLTNPTKVGGIVKVSFMSRRRGGIRGGGRGGISEDYSRILWIGAETSKDMGIVLDQQPFFMTLDTYVSRNIPALEVRNFRGLKLKQNEKPLEYEETNAFTGTAPGTNGEYIVDNEDPGFEVLSKAKESWLKRTVKNIFGSNEKQSPYDRFNVINPPGNWTSAAFQEFFGKFIQSGVYKKSGNGKSKVAWNVDLKEPGDYDIYFYYEGEMRMLRFMRRGRGGQRDGNRQQGQRGQPPSQNKTGKKHFVVYHEDGQEEIAIDLKDAQPGWNLLGTFRLTAGKNRIELTDKNDLGYVSADAVKWIKRD